MEQIAVRETCAFDSIFQVVANGIGMRDAYKIDLIELNPPNHFIQLIIDILTRGKIVASDYNTRATILCNILIFN